MPDTTTIAPQLAQLRREADTLNHRLAAAEYAAAAAILRQTFLDLAGELLFAVNQEDPQTTEVIPLVLLTDAEQLAWYNAQDFRHESCDYPGNQALRERIGGRIAKDLTTGDFVALVDHLRRGYEAAMCAGAGHLPTEPGLDDYFGADVNVLVLDITAALQPAKSQQRLPLSPRFAEAMAGVPTGRFAAVVLDAGASIGYAGHFATYSEALRSTGPSLTGGNRQWFVASTDDTGTLTVYAGRDARLVDTMPAKPMFADPAAGSGGSAICCNGHRAACHFGRDHRWSVWYRDGKLVRTSDTFHCVTCGGVCTGDEPDGIRP